VAETFEFEGALGGLSPHATSTNGRISKYDLRKLCMIGCFNVLYISETPATSMWARVFYTMRGAMKRLRLDPKLRSK
jgi:hypothetical protein